MVCYLKKQKDKRFIVINISLRFLLVLISLTFFVSISRLSNLEDIFQALMSSRQTQSPLTLFIFNHRYRRIEWHRRPSPLLLLDKFLLDGVCRCIDLCRVFGWQGWCTLWRVLYLYMRYFSISVYLRCIWVMRIGNPYQSTIWHSQIYINPHLLGVDIWLNFTNSICDLQHITRYQFEEDSIFELHGCKVFQNMVPRSILRFYVSNRNLLFTL